MTLEKRPLHDFLMYQVYRRGGRRGCDSGGEGGEDVIQEGREERV